MANDNNESSGVFPVNELGELILSVGAGSTNITGWTPSNQIPQDIRTGRVRAVFGPAATESATVGNDLTFYVKEGYTVKFTSNSATGTITKYKADGSVDFTQAVTNGQVFSYGAYSGTQKFIVSGVTSGSIDVTTESASLALTSFATVRTPIERFAALNIRPMGFNSYSLLPDRYYAVPGADVARPFILQYIKDTGANLVRVAASAFAANDYLERVHNTAQMPDIITDANTRQTFKDACDAYMNELASYGLMGMNCLVWTQGSLPTVFNETWAQAYGDLNSKTSAYARSMITWFVKRYKNHPALGIITLGNEYVMDTEQVGAPTPAQMGAWFKSVADAGRAVKPDLLVTANITPPIMNLTRTRELPEAFLSRLSVVFAGLDIICVHIYNYYSFMGHNNLDIGTVPSSFFNSFGFEGVEAWMQGMRDFADVERKPLIVGEGGVDNNTEECDPVNATHYSDRKKNRFATGTVPYADCVLWWNAQDTDSAPANQKIWAIDPRAATNRAADHARITKDFNQGVADPRGLGVMTAARRRALAPKYMMRCSDRSAGKYIRFTATSAHQSSDGYVAMFWMTLRQALNNFESIMNFTDAGGLSGFRVNGLLSANNRSFYSEGFDASGSTGNTLNGQPDLVLDQVYHFTYKFKQFNSNGTLTGGTELLRNGNYLLSIPGATTRFPAAIIPTTVCYVMCNPSNGVPMDMQDFALFPNANFTDEDVFAHMRGEISQKSLLHVRGLPDGTIVDVSKNATTLTVSGITVVTKK